MLYNSRDPLPAGLKWTGPASHVVSEFLNPLSQEEFLAGYWGMETVHLSQERIAPSHFPSLSELEMFQCIARAKLRPTDIRVAKNGVEVNTADLANKRGFLSVSDLWKRWTDGATIIVNSADIIFPWLAHYCRNLEAWLNHPITSRIYFSPPNSAAFAAHQDGHDVFVVQLGGEKRWGVWSESVSGHVVPMRPPDQVFNLQRPDLLYLPKNVWHEVATGDSFSIHVTIGLHLSSWRMLLEWVLKDSGDVTRTLDERLDACLLADRPESLAADLQNKMAAVLTQLSSDDILRILANRMARWSECAGDSFLDTTSSPVSLHRYIVLCRPFELLKINERHQLKIGQRFVDLPTEACALIKMLSISPLHQQLPLPASLSPISISILSDLVSCGTASWVQ